jgi:phospholipase C
MNKKLFYVPLLIAAFLVASCSLSKVSGPTAPVEPTADPVPPDTVAVTVEKPDSLSVARSKIKHILIIMQENRSFDEYFGTYPGADGIPMKDGVPTVCVPDPKTNVCIKPYHDPNDVDAGGPHGQAAAVEDIDGGKMDGFVAAFRSAQKACKNPNLPGCAAGENPDVMGYHDGSDLPNYWAYAKNFVLQDRMFEPNASWSLPAHLFMVSAWSAKCTRPGDPASCTSDIVGPSGLDVTKNDYAWTDLTYLLHKAGISWAYYLSEGQEPDCENDAMFCQPKNQSQDVPGIWNPLPGFDTVKQDGELRNIQTLDKYIAAAKAGTLPSVAWVVPEQNVSEHPPAKISLGQSYVTGLINAAMQGPEWNSTAIYLAWDDWGGFYDHVVPPTIDRNGYGLRVPGLLISPFARTGFIDHQTLSFDAYLKFIEDIFLNGQRLDPATDGRPDPRPNVRENAPGLGDLLLEFDFAQSPRPALMLPTGP